MSACQVHTWCPQFGRWHTRLRQQLPSLARHPSHCCHNSAPFQTVQSISHLRRCWAVTRLLHVWCNRRTASAFTLPRVVGCHAMADDDARCFCSMVLSYASILKVGVASRDLGTGSCIIITIFAPISFANLALLKTISVEK